MMPEKPDIYSVRLSEKSDNFSGARSTVPSSSRQILLYLPALLGGGAERVMAVLASGLAARGWRVCLVVDRHAPENLPFLSPDVRLHVLPGGRLRRLYGLWRLLLSVRPDVCLSALGWSNLCLCLAAMLAGCADRTILTFHGFTEDERGTGGRLAYALIPLLSRLSAASVAVSQALRDDLFTRHHAAPAQTCIIHNPAVPEPFPAVLSPAALAARAPIILAMGRLVPEKDHLTLMRAFGQIRTAGARLVIVGEGPLRAILEAEAALPLYAGTISLPGYCDDVAGFFAQARCLAITSHHEAFSLVCVEALAYGLPVVSTACGGPEEILAPLLEHQNDGAPATTSPAAWLVPVGDVAALARAIDQALAAPGDPAPRQALARRFDRETALDRYEALCLGVIAHGRRWRDHGRDV